MKILLLGATGQLGKSLCHSLPLVGNTKAVGRNQVDLSTKQSVLRLIDEFEPNVIVNAAAYTNVKKAETEREQAYQVNALAVEFLAIEAERRNIWLIHYSTDYVFDGTKSEPYIETDKPCPVNVYGESKLAGEKAIIANHYKYLIFRTSWVIGTNGNNFASTIMKLACEQNTINVISDQFGVPTSPSLITRATVDAINAIAAHEHWPSGIYNLVPNGATTWYEIAKILVQRAIDANHPLKTNSSGIRAISAKEFPTTVKRPQNSTLNTDKIQKQLSYKLPHWTSDFNATVDDILEATEQA